MKQHPQVRNTSCSGNDRMTSRENGFSLTELMIVGALIAVMAAVAIPSIAGATRQYAVTTASQQVASAIRAARVQAVGRNQLLHVDFDAAAGTFQVQDAGDAAVGSLFTLPVGTQFVDADTDIEFSTSGRLSTPALAPITVVVGNGDANLNRTITVTASGRVLLP